MVIRNTVGTINKAAKVRGEGVEGLLSIHRVDWGGFGSTQPFCLESYTQSVYTVITPSADLEALA